MAGLSPFAGRLVPARPDLAAAHLRGRVAAARFAVGVPAMVAVPLLDLAAAPGPEAERATQLLFGERFVVYEERGGHAWGQAAGDGYVGYVPLAGLRAPEEGETVAVTALRTHLYPEPSIKRRPLAALPFMARLAVCPGFGTGPGDGFVAVAGGGFVPEAHLQPVGGEFVAQAERFLGLPYLWGGRSAEGLDCSGLVQLALLAVGTAAPRDSDMQAALVGAPLAPDAAAARGDLVFWDGHVGIMASGEDLLHANAHAMAVTREPLAAVAARVEAAGGGKVTARRRGAAGRATWLPEDLAPGAGAGAGQGQGQGHGHGHGR